MHALPSLMVAPNGARRTKADHPALPITIPEIVECAVACHAAGADGIHAHVRDSEQRHVLDIGLYRELLAELGRTVPDMLAQITTEAADKYSPVQQRRLVEKLCPKSVSIALREITADGDTYANRRLFAYCDEAGIAVQLILYDTDDIDLLAALIAERTVPAKGLHLLHVLGRYAPGQASSPADLEAPLARQKEAGIEADWAVCAFGRAETDCLVAARRAGGKVRIGLENGLWNRDGTIARDNAERIADYLAAMAGRPLQTERASSSPGEQAPVTCPTQTDAAASPTPPPAAPHWSAPQWSTPVPPNSPAPVAAAAQASAVPADQTAQMASPAPAMPRPADIAMPPPAATVQPVPNPEPQAASPESAPAPSAAQPVVAAAAPAAPPEAPASASPAAGKPAGNLQPEHAPAPMEPAPTAPAAPTAFPAGVDGAPAVPASGSQTPALATSPSAGQDPSPGPDATAEAAAMPEREDRQRETGAPAEPAPGRRE